MWYIPLEFDGSRVGPRYLWKGLVSMKSLSIVKFKARCEQVLASRGLVRSTKVVAIDTFIDQFIAFAWYFHGLYGDGNEMLLILDKPAVTDLSIWNTNFRGNLLSTTAVDPRLAANRTWSALIPKLVAFKGKGVGVGELLLPLLVSGWKYSTESDGILLDMKREIKDATGGSLKPVPTGLTDKGLVDRLVKKYFGGNPPGLIGGSQKTRHEQHAEYVKNLPNPVEAYKGFLTELYPTRPVGELASRLVSVIDDVAEWKIILGVEVFKWYQKSEGFASLLLVDSDSLEFVNIARVSRDVVKIGVTFTPKMKRGKDTQAVPDGYVNISMKIGTSRNDK